MSLLASSSFDQTIRHLKFTLHDEKSSTLSYLACVLELEVATG